MIPKPRNMKFEQTIQAPIETVFRAFTNSTLLREWLCEAAQADPRPQGRLYLWWQTGYYMCGEFITIEAPNALTYSWNGRGDPGGTEVLITLSAHHNTTTVTVKHSKVKARGAWIHFREEIQKGWERGLANLKSVLESGQDLRITQRPMLGVLLGNLETAKAAHLETPVSEGVLLDGTIEGMGAYNAGLRKNDIIVNVAGQPVTNFASLGSALQGRAAGEQVEVVYYRGDKANVTVMELTRRQLPEVPASPADLVATLRQTYSESRQELSTCLDGVSDEETSRQPAPQEWSVKQTLAHLIHSERGVHEFMSDLVNLQERVSDSYGDNITARIDATVAAYPTTGLLVEEFIRNQEETLAFVANLPAEFVQRKSSYWRIGQLLLQFVNHTREHLNQIKAAIQAARS